MTPQHIDIKLAHRIETGALKIGDDWTGYFIRGDNAMYLCQAIENILDVIENSDGSHDYLWLDLQTLHDFANDLRKV
ncbi:MAG: hypothetical protein WC554_10245 [Clostridia bacterium]